MCDPVTLALGLAASTGGAALTGSSNAATANAQAQAANNILTSKLNTLDGIYANQTGPTFADLMDNYSPAASSTGLTDAQNARTAAGEDNIWQQTADGVPLGEGGSPATQEAYAGQFKNAFDYATTAAENAGTVGGYTDDWFNDALADANAGRTIGAADNIAEGQKALIAPEQQLAENAAYRPPSPWGSIVSGAGNVLGSWAGTTGNGIGGISGNGGVMSTALSNLWNPISGIAGSGGNGGQALANSSGFGQGG
jgi:hypothetical protein